MVVDSRVPPEEANFSLKNNRFGRVVLCPFCCVVALPFSASLGVIVHRHKACMGLNRRSQYSHLHIRVYFYPMSSRHYFFLQAIVQVNI